MPGTVAAGGCGGSVGPRFGEFVHVDVLRFLRGCTPCALQPAAQSTCVSCWEHSPTGGRGPARRAARAPTWPKGETQQAHGRPARRAAGPSSRTSRPTRARRPSTGVERVEHQARGKREQLERTLGEQRDRSQTAELAELFSVSRAPYRVLARTRAQAS